MRITKVALSVAIALTGALIAGPVSPARAAAGGTADPAAVKADLAAPPTPLSAADRALLKAKEKAITARTGVTTLATLTSNKLGYNRQLQEEKYWCGPAATSMALFSLKIYDTNQTTAAGLLKTTTDGTAWSGVYANVPNPTGYPIRDVLNYKLGSTFYAPIALPGNPTAAQKAAYQIYLVNDINAGYPLVGNAVEVVGGPHLLGHPNQNIWHWYTIYGYYNSGAGTYYEDSASYAANGGLGAMDSDTITVINGGRGYLW